MPASGCFTSGTVRGNRSRSRSFRSTPDSVLSDGGEVGERQRGEGDVPVPANPGADLILMEADLTLALLEQALDGPS